MAKEVEYVPARTHVRTHTRPHAHTPARAHARTRTRDYAHMYVQEVMEMLKEHDDAIQDGYDDRYDICLLGCLLVGRSFLFFGCWVAC